jgi:plasmid stability protein
MLICMRTTINLPDGLAEAVKRRAADEGRTFTSVVEEALRDLLARATAERERTLLPTFGTPGGHILVDLDDREAVWAALDQDGAT